MKNVREVVMRKYEIAVLSKGAFARTVRIYRPKSADRALIVNDCTIGGNALDGGLDILRRLKTHKIKNTAVACIEGAPESYLPFDGNGQSNKVFSEYCDYLTTTVIPYLDKRFGFKTYGMLGTYTAGCATLCYAAKQNKRVCAYALLSAPLFMCADGFDKFLPDAAFNPKDGFYIYSGGTERPDGTPEQAADAFIASAFKAVSALRASKVQNIKLRIDGQSEFSDAARTAPAAEFLTDFSKL